MRVAQSGGVRCATRPDSKRSRRRCSMPVSWLGQAVAGEHQLPAGVVERVEGVEELLLGLGLAGEELDVVDQEHVDVAVEALEAVERLAVERGDEAVGERLDGRVADRGRRVEAA